MDSKDHTMVYESIPDDRCNAPNCTQKGVHKHNGKEYCQSCLNEVMMRETW